MKKNWCKISIHALWWWWYKTPCVCVWYLSISMIVSIFFSSINCARKQNKKFQWPIADALYKHPISEPKKKWSKTKVKGLRHLLLLRILGSFFFVRKEKFAQATDQCLKKMMMARDQMVIIIVWCWSLLDKVLHPRQSSCLVYVITFCFCPSSRWWWWPWSIA